MQSTIKLKGFTEFSLKDKSGKTKKIFHTNALWKLIKKTLDVDLQIPMLTGIWSDKSLRLNTVTTVGKAAIAAAIPVTHIALGVGTPSATALGSESTTNGASRAAATVTAETTSTTDDTAQYYKEFTFTGSLALTEEGLFTASSGGTMVASQTFSTLNVEDGDQLNVTHKIVATAS